MMGWANLTKGPDKPECFYAFKLGKMQIFKTRRREEDSKRYLAGIVEMLLHCIFLQCTYPGFLMHHFRILFHLLQGLVVNMTIHGGKIICMPLKEEENVLKILLRGSSIPKPSPNSPFLKKNWTEFDGCHITCSWGLWYYCLRVQEFSHFNINITLYHSDFHVLTGSSPVVYRILFIYSVALSKSEVHCTWRTWHL